MDSKEVLSTIPRKITIIGLETIPEVKPGDDIAKLILEAIKRENIELDDGDIIVIAQKIISKAENRFVDLNNVLTSIEAFRLARILDKDPRLIELILKESSEVVKTERGHIIVTTKHGITCANAGIDASNVKGTEDVVLLLPEDPDASAEKIRQQILQLTGKKVGVIISDTYGRPLREGQINMAIGASGVRLFKDYRGKPDMKGYTLKVKNIAVAEELASAAELVMGQATEKIPVAIIKGLSELITDEKVSARSLNMPKEKWLFR